MEAASLEDGEMHHIKSEVIRLGFCRSYQSTNGKAMKKLTKTC